MHSGIFVDHRFAKVYIESDLGVADVKRVESTREVPGRYLRGAGVLNQRARLLGKPQEGNLSDRRTPALLTRVMKSNVYVYRFLVKFYI